jgi:hypothetical protein
VRLEASVIILLKYEGALDQGSGIFVLIALDQASRFHEISVKRSVAAWIELFIVQIMIMR